MKKNLKFLLTCGILASFIYIISDIIAAISWKDYSYLNQSVSELRAIGAPTRPFLIPMLILYALFEIAFGFGVRNADNKFKVRMTGLLLIVLGIIDMIAIFTPMNLRGSESSITDILHIIATVITVIMILLIIGFGARSDGKWFFYFSLATILMLIIFGIWSFMSAPDIASNQPTPFIGIKERVNIYGFEIWMAVLAIALLHMDGY